jgi:hypothetical protein
MHQSAGDAVLHRHETPASTDDEKMDKDLTTATAVPVALSQGV